MTYRSKECACKLVQCLFLGACIILSTSLCAYCIVWALCLSETCLCVCLRAYIHNTPHPSPPQSSPLYYEIYCKTALWESTHALPSLRTAPWQLLLYIPLQMRAMNWRDYRVEQEQRGRGGKRKSEASWERRGEWEGEGEGEREREEGRRATQVEVPEVCFKLYFALFINHSVCDKLCFSLKNFLFST